MADEDLASQEAEGAVVEDNDAPQTEGSQQQADDTPEPIANLARDLGWTPREEWQGDAEKWKPAEQFIRDGRDIQQTTARELRSLREQMDRMSGVTETIVQDRVAAARNQWEAEMTRAVEEGDTQTALKLARQEPRAPAPPNGESAEFRDWKAKNPWFVTNPLAQAVAIDAAEKVKHLPPAQQFEMAQRAVKRDFPELFQTTQPAKQPPATQTAATRSTAPANRQKGFADMPAASQQVARQMIERHSGLTLEAIAKSYWADQTRSA